MTDFDFDLFVIGGGSGGVRAGRVAAETGARVGLAEQSRMGGTCVIRGCVPKKLMVYASGYRQQIADARDYGWDVQAGGFDWRRFRRRLDAELDRLESVYRTNLARPGARIFDQRATVAGPQEIALADGRRLRARHILIATGGHPTRPDIPGAELAMVSDDLFLMEDLPQSLLIVGGGYIGCEFACIFAGMGVSVAQYYRRTRILRGFDAEAADLVADGIRGCGVDLRTDTDVIRLERAADGIRVHDTAGGSRTFAAVLFATGRSPNTAGLGLQAAGVELAPSGAVPVNVYSATTVPSIHAVGDVTDRVALTPVAIREGAAFVETVFRNNPVAVDHTTIASAVFTQPELGTVGLSEADAAAREPVEIYTAIFRPMQGAFIDRPGRTMFKLVVAKATQRVLGCHIVAPGAAEMIQIAAVAVKLGATKAQFDAAVAVHPTMAEELVLMKTPVRTNGPG